MNNRQSKVLRFPLTGLSLSRAKMILFFEKNGVCYYENHLDGKRMFQVEYEGGSFYPTFIAKTEDSLWVYEVIEESEVSVEALKEKTNGLIRFINNKKDSGVEVNGGVVRYLGGEWYEYCAKTNEWLQIEILKTKIISEKSVEK